MKEPKTYALTIREMNDDGSVELAGIDLTLDVNSKGRLIFPDQLFQEAKKILASNRGVKDEHE
jgi:hypothetical protein